MWCSQKVVELSFEQKSQWERSVSNFGSNSDCALCNDQRGACVRKTWRVLVCVLSDVVVVGKIASSAVQKVLGYTGDEAQLLHMIKAPYSSPHI